MVWFEYPLKNNIFEAWCSQRLRNRDTNKKEETFNIGGGGVRMSLSYCKLVRSLKH